MDRKPCLYIIISAALFGISAPLAKVLLGDISSVALAGLLYIGAFLSLSLYSLFLRLFVKDHREKTQPLEKRDIPWLTGAVAAGGVIAPISLMLGLNLISGFSASLLLNLEGVCTALIAVFVFKENAGKRLWIALLCMTSAGVILSWDPSEGKFNVLGPLLIVLATLCWGIDNNLTRQISDKDPAQITWIKGLAAGTISLTLAAILGMKIQLGIAVLYAILLGALSYGVSLIFFIRALKGLGASRTGAFFSLGPFIGALASLFIFKNWAYWIMLPAFCFMAAGVWLIVYEKHSHTHVHAAISHTHSHTHDDLHHLHEHGRKIRKAHTHEHIHPELTHTHSHWPDTSHRHIH